MEGHDSTGISFYVRLQDIFYQSQSASQQSYYIYATNETEIKSHKHNLYNSANLLATKKSNKTLKQLLFRGTQVTFKFTCLEHVKLHKNDFPPNIKKNVAVITGMSKIKTFICLQNLSMVKQWNLRVYLLIITLTF